MNKLYKFYIDKLYKLGSHDKENKIIRCSGISRDAYKSVDNNTDSLLFDQIRKELKNELPLDENGNFPLYKVIIAMDFNNFKKKIMSLQLFENGFELSDDHGNKATFKLFVKSNSMSRSFECYYINSKYEERIMKRISFDLIKDSEKVKLSKWSAYLGLSCSSAKLCNTVHLSEEEVAIVEDKVQRIESKCLTAISVSYLLSLNKRILDNNDNKETLFYIKKEIQCYLNSPDFKRLNEEKDGTKIIRILNSLIRVFDLSSSERKEVCNKLKKDYNVDTQGKRDFWHKFHVSEFPIEVNFFDGVGLINNKLQQEICNDLNYEDEINYIDEDYEEENIEYNNYSFQIRLPFIKGMVHTCDLQKFFRRKKVEKIKSIKNFVKDENERYEYKDVSKIKMIITESQFKGSKYFDKLPTYPSQVSQYFSFLKRYDYPLAIANIETREDKKGRLNYQFLTTMPFESADVEHMIDTAKTEISRHGEFASIKNSVVYNAINDNDPDSFMIRNYEKYYRATKRYDSKRNENMESELRDSLVGKIRCGSSRRYLAPDLLELLYHIIGENEVPDEQKLDITKFYAPYTKLENEKRYNNTDYNNVVNIILRNPHYSRNEIVISTRDTCLGKERDEYFDKLYGVLMINPRSFSADRLGGADYDGDSVLMVFDSYYTTNMKNRLIRDGNYINSFAKIPSILEPAVEYNYTNKIRSLNGTFSNETGMISNYAFRKAVKDYGKPNIQDDLAFLTILSGLEIDSAKTGKKPELPKLDSSVNVFLKMKETIKNPNKEKMKDSDYYYKKKSLQKKIESIASNSKSDKDDNEFHIIYKIDDELLKYKKPKNIYYNKAKAIKELRLNKIYNTDGVAKVKGIISAYNELMRKNKMIKEAREGKIENIGIVKNEIDEILKRRYDINSFLKELKTDKTKTTLSLYTQASEMGYCYHFLTSKDERIDFINNTLHLSLNNDVLNIVTDFEKGGYKLLYLGLYYNKENDELNANVDLTKNEDSGLDELNNHDKTIAIEARNHIINSIAKETQIGLWNYQELLDYITFIIDNDFKDITFLEVANAIDLIKDSYQFLIFGNKMVEYFKERDGYDEE